MSTISIRKYYHVTITDTHITIGCESHTKEFWASAGYTEVFAMDGTDSAKAWEKFKPAIMLLAEE